jgi:hypothetical protein
MDNNNDPFIRPLTDGRESFLEGDCASITTFLLFDHLPTVVNDDRASIVDMTVAGNRSESGNDHKESVRERE